MARIAVIGAGVVGLAAALALRADGHEVIVFDRDPEGDKCSWGNAGALAVTEIVPRSGPGLLRKIPGWLLDPLGPLALRPGHLPRLLPWLARFLASGRAAEVAKAAAALAALHALTAGEWRRLLAATGMSGELRETGALTLYRTERGFAEDRRFWAISRAHGIAFEELTPSAARAMEPALTPDIARAVFTPGWMHVSDPKAIWAGLLAAARGRGIGIRRAEITSLAAPGVVADERFERILVAAGAWSARLVHSAGERALLEAERGYNTTLPRPGIEVGRELIFAEHHFVATPLAVGLRIGGAAEFAGLAAPPNYARAAALLTLARRYLPGLDPAGGTVWMGQRPSTPDSLPVIGLSPRRPDLAYAFGHGHLGLTQAAGTARLIAELIAGRAPAIDPAPFAITRFA